MENKCCPCCLGAEDGWGSVQVMYELGQHEGGAPHGDSRRRYWAILLLVLWSSSL